MLMLMRRLMIRFLLFYFLLPSLDQLYARNEKLIEIEGADEDGRFHLKLKLSLCQFHFVLTFTFHFIYHSLIVILLLASNDVLPRLNVGSYSLF